MTVSVARLAGSTFAAWPMSGARTLTAARLGRKTAGTSSNLIPSEQGLEEATDVLEEPLPEVASQPVLRVDAAR